MQHSSTDRPAKIHAITRGGMPFVAEADAAQKREEAARGYKLGYMCDEAKAAMEKAGWFLACLCSGDNYVWARAASDEFPATHEWTAGTFGHAWACIA